MAGGTEPLVVIGLAGPMRSGKDSVAAALAPLGFWRVALADGIKSALDDLGGPQREAHKLLDAAGWSNRKAWQLLGTEAREAIEAHQLWIDLLGAKVAFLAKLLPPDQQVRRFVIPDVRYPQEALELADIARALDGHYETWRIQRPGFGTSGGHSSEQMVDKIGCERTILNDRSLETLGLGARGFAALMISEATMKASRGDHAG